MRSIAKLGIAIAIILLSLSSASAELAKVAQIKTSSGQVTVVRDGARLPAKVGDQLYEKDTLQTGADSGVGITFTDNTALSMGPNSEVALAEYKFDSSNFKGAMLTDMRRGTLSMVSGDIARSSPGAMKVKTPTAILGVRGTRFAVQVGGSD
jgi:hypothetical protein